MGEVLQLHCFKIQVTQVHFLAIFTFWIIPTFNFTRNPNEIFVEDTYLTLLLCYIFQNHPAWKKKNLHYFKMKKNLQLLFHNVPSLKNTLFFTKLTNVQVAPFKTFCWDIPKIIGLSIIYYFLQRVFPFSRYTNGTFHWRNGSVKIGNSY